MKKIFALIVASLVLSACNDDSIKNTCGNGVLDETEICDGNKFSSQANIKCSNGLQPDYSKLRCTESCSIDAAGVCQPKCGDGIISGDEECDLTYIPTITASCKNPDLTKLSCDSSCHLVDNGVCPESSSSKDICGNGKLDANEMCDGTLFREGSKVCPDNMAELPNAEYRCLSSCRIVDVSKACTDVKNLPCGNKALDSGEQCDGQLISTEALSNLKCEDNEVLVKQYATCSDKCMIESACAAKSSNEHFFQISELVPHYTGDNHDALAIELHNMLSEENDVSMCSLALMDETKVAKKYPLKELGITKLAPEANVVICSQKTTSDMFGGVCNAIISQDGILENISNKVLLGIVCGTNDDFQDLVNVKSYLVAILEHGVTDFIRKCGMNPIHNTENAIFGDDWDITLQDAGAPTYDLGKHCEPTDQKPIPYCKYTISRDKLTDRNQAVDLALELKVPGITDISNKTDVSKDILIEFYAGQISDQNGLLKVESQSEHYAKSNPDLEWTNEDGIDRYTAQLKNWDRDQGFWISEAGQYVHDAWISFDNGRTHIYCGPNGVFEDYENFNASERNRLSVEYNDKDTEICGDGILTSSETCDNGQVVSNALVCTDPSQTIASTALVNCFYCNYVSTANACQTMASPTCGNGTIEPENGEICDTNTIPDNLKKCPANHVPKDGSPWTCTDCFVVTSSDIACEPACGNHKLDTNVPQNASGTETYNEVCDGEFINEEEAKKVCGSNQTYYSYKANRAVCTDACKVGKSACTSNIPVVFDEYLLDVENNSVKNIAISLNNYGDTSIDMNKPLASTKNCEIYFTESGLEGNTYKYKLVDYIKDNDDNADTAMLAPCVPFVVCAGDNKDAFGNKCDAFLPDITPNVLSQLVEVELHCTIATDFLDIDGLLDEQNSNGLIHGKLKASDRDSWVDRSSVDVKQRMDLDNSPDLTSFATPVCSK